MPCRCCPLFGARGKRSKAPILPRGQILVQPHSVSRLLHHQREANLSRPLFLYSIILFLIHQHGYSPGMVVSLIRLNNANTVQRLARILDRPLFPWKKLIVGFSLAQYFFEGFLSLRQYQVLKHTSPPKVLKNEVSQEVFDKSQVRNTIHSSIAHLTV
jgi:hypothetical protein